MRNLSQNEVILVKSSYNGSSFAVFRAQSMVRKDGKVMFQNCQVLSTQSGTFRPLLIPPQTFPESTERQTVIYSCEPAPDWFRHDPLVPAVVL
jgi:hypothetical protein